MSKDPEAEEGMLQFFLVDLQEMSYLTCTQNLQKALPKFFWEDEGHEVLKLHLGPSDRIGCDGHVIQVENLQESLEGEQWDDLLDKWMDKAWGPAS